MQYHIFENLVKQIEAGNIVDICFEGNGSSRIRRFIPRERLILLGGGHISLALCKIAAMLGFSVIVVDDRPSFCNPLRFPEAEQTICDDFKNAIRKLGIRETDFVCVITRGHKHDADCLGELLVGTMPEYLGMIGSRRRVRGLLELLKEERFDQNRLAQVVAPIGLNINAQTTTEIAVSIAAQLVQYRRKDYRHSENGLSDCMMQTNVDMPLLKTLASPREPMMLAVVMDNRGSTPVKDGSMMAIGKLGPIAGTIGGGCGEAEITQIARQMLGTGEKTVVSVNMTNDIAGDEGMVCGGIMHVLLEEVECGDLAAEHSQQGGV